MRKLKYLVFLSALFFLSGCKAVYYLDIDNNYTETLNLFPRENDYEDKNYVMNYSFNIPVDYREVEESDINGELIGNPKLFKVDKYDKYMSLSNSFTSFTNFSYSPSYRSCFKSIYFSNDSLKKIETDNSFSCFDIYPNLDELDINIITSKHVAYNNADEVNNNTYTWKFTKDNYTYKSIIFDYSEFDNKTKKNEKTDNKENKKDNASSGIKNKKNLLYILIPLFFITLFAIIISRNKDK